MGRDIFNKIRLPRALSYLTLNVSGYGASTTSLGNLFQCLTSFIVKNVFLISSLYLPSFSLKKLPLVLSQLALLKSLSPKKSSKSYEHKVWLNILTEKKNLIA